MVGSSWWGHYRAPRLDVGRIACFLFYFMRLRVGRDIDLTDFDVRGVILKKILSNCRTFIQYFYIMHSPFNVSSSCFSKSGLRATGYGFIIPSDDLKGINDILPKFDFVLHKMEENIIKSSGVQRIVNLIAIEKWRTLIKIPFQQSGKKWNRKIYLSFFKVPLKASITPRWYSCLTMESAQDLLAVCLFDAVSRPVTLRPSWRTNIDISHEKLL